MVKVSMIKQEIIENNFNFAFKATTYKNVNIALKAYEEFMNINNRFFEIEQSDLFGRILSYAIDKQFNDSSFTPKSNYSVVRKDVNGYKHKALFIETDDFTLNIGKTMKITQLLPKAKYKFELAKRNAEYNNQYELDMIKNHENELGIEDISLPRHYGVITYGYLNKRLTHLQLIIPDSTYKAAIHTDNLLINSAQYDSYVPKAVEEEDIVKLRQSIRTALEKGIV
jgi:hypothetical protein